MAGMDPGVIGDMRAIFKWKNSLCPHESNSYI